MKHDEAPSHTGGLVAFHGFRSLVIGLNFGDDNVYLAWSASRLLSLIHI